MSERRFRELERAILRGSDIGESSQEKAPRKHTHGIKSTFKEKKARCIRSETTSSSSVAALAPKGEPASAASQKDINSADSISIVKMSDHQFEAVVDDMLLTYNLDGELRNLEDSLEMWKAKVVASGEDQEQKPEEEEGDEDEYGLSGSVHIDRRGKHLKDEGRNENLAIRRSGETKEDTVHNNVHAMPTKAKLSLALYLGEREREKRYAKGNKMTNSSPITSARQLSPPSTASSVASTELLHTSRTEKDRPRSGEMKQRAGWKRRRWEQRVRIGVCIVL